MPYRSPSSTCHPMSRGRLLIVTLLTMGGSTRQAIRPCNGVRVLYTDYTKAQLRPSTGMYDEKESLWLQRGSDWPSDEDVPGFRDTTAHFMAKCATISEQLCTCCFNGAFCSGSLISSGSYLLCDRTGIPIRLFLCRKRCDQA